MCGDPPNEFFSSGNRLFLVNEVLASIETPRQAKDQDVYQYEKEGRRENENDISFDSVDRSH